MEIGPAELRASDDDRDHVAEIVRRAATEGRLDLDEMRERLEQVYAARTYGELSRVTTDLPGPIGPDGSNGTSGFAGLRPGPSELSAVFGTQRLDGPWLVPSTMRLRAVFGEIRLDLTEAIVPHQVRIDARIAVGEIGLTVPDDIAVVLEPGELLFGSRTNRTRADPGPGTPLVRIRSWILLGEVTARPPRRWFGR